MVRSMAIVGIFPLLIAGCAPVFEEVDVPGAVVTTTAGAFTIELDPNAAPQSVANFNRLVNESFYDGVVFHEVAAGEHVRTGAYTLAPELVSTSTDTPVVNDSATDRLNLRGTVAFAPLVDVALVGAEFVINLADNSAFDATTDQPGHAVFGRVVDGLAIVESIAAQPVEARDTLTAVPVDDVLIESIALTTLPQSALTDYGRTALFDFANDFRNLLRELLSQGIMLGLSSQLN